MLVRIATALTPADIDAEIRREEGNALKFAGAKIRRKARDLLRRRKAASSPGQPPSHHAKDQRFSLKWIKYEYDRGARTLVIGPLLTGRSRLQPGVTIPQMHEHGGGFLIKQMRLPTIDTRPRGGRYGPDDWQPYRGRTEAKWRKYNTPFETRTITSTYPARPWMIRALEAELDSLPAGWKGKIGGP